MSAELNIPNKTPTYLGLSQEVFITSNQQKLFIESGYTSAPARQHPLEISIMQHEAEKLGLCSLELEGYVNVFSEDNTFIGGVVLYRRWQAIAIYSFHLPVELRGQGLGKRILVLAEALSKKMGGKMMVLETSTLHSYQFYLNNGFEITSELEGYIDGHRVMQMIKTL